MLTLSCLLEQALQTREHRVRVISSEMADGRATRGTGSFFINLTTHEGDKRPLGAGKDKVLESGSAPPPPGQRQPGCDWAEFLFLISGQ